MDRPAIRYSNEDKRLAVSLGCPIEYANEVVYGGSLNLNFSDHLTQVGVNCRLCPRKQCEQREHETFFFELDIDENKRGITHLES